jgi:hypothetical protein
MVTKDLIFILTLIVAWSYSPQSRQILLCTFKEKPDFQEPEAEMQTLFSQSWSERIGSNIDSPVGSLQTRIYA